MAFKLNKDKFNFGEGTGSSPQKLLKNPFTVTKTGKIKFQNPFGINKDDHWAVAGLKDNLGTLMLVPAYEVYKQGRDMHNTFSQLGILPSSKVNTYKAPTVETKSKNEVVTKPKTKQKTSKTSFDKAYKNRDMNIYGNMSKSEYIKEAKRQKTLHGKTGKWDIKKSY